jgi:HSP20 family molecular chaperone IbpA
MEHHFFRMVGTPNGMALEPWRKLDRLFRSSTKPLAAEGGSSIDAAETAHNARVMVSETPESFQIRVDLPPMLRSGLRLLIKDNFLILTNTDSEDLAVAMNNGFNLPPGKPAFLQAFPLPAAIQAGKARARLHNGALYVSVPKAPDSKPTEVEINDTPKDRTEGE